MAEATTLGTWLRRERERRGVSLTAISDQTKLSIPLLRGLEADDLSRWPGGIFRRAFARSYATAIGVDPDLVVRRLEEEHPSEDSAAPAATPAPASSSAPATRAAFAPAATPRPRARARRGSHPRSAGRWSDRIRVCRGGLSSAVASARIAVYHALGLIFTGRSPMLALLLDQARRPRPSRTPSRCPRMHPARAPIARLPPHPRGPQPPGSASPAAGRPEARAIELLKLRTTSRSGWFRAQAQHRERTRWHW